jgi:hypothetical protein
MYQKRNLLLILSCFILLVTNILFASEEIGTKTAYVQAIDAIIYSDPFLKIPIGKVSRGTLISVGKPLLKHPAFVPVIIAGRVAYIQLADLDIGAAGNLAEDSQHNLSGKHDPDLLIPPPSENILENNTGYFEFHRFSSGTELATMFQNIDGVNLTNMLGLSGSVLHHQSSSIFLWGIGTEFYSQTSLNVNYSFFLLNPTIGFTPIHNLIFCVDLLFSLDFSLGTNFVIQNNYYTETPGFWYGPSFGARFELFPKLKYHLIGTISYRSYKAVGAKDYFDDLDFSYPAVKSIGGINLSLGFAINF